MAEAFADTSGWAALFVKRQPFHLLADDIVKQWMADGTSAVTTNYVLAELVALLTSPLRIPRPQQIALLEDLKATPWVEIVHVDPVLDARSWAFLKARPDKAWSLVDCASFVLMQDRGITEALTTDHHFEQAGFVRLLK